MTDRHRHSTRSGKMKSTKIDVIGHGEENEEDDTTTEGPPSSKTISTHSTVVNNLNVSNKEDNYDHKVAARNRNANDSIIKTLSLDASGPYSSPASEPSPQKSPSANLRSRTSNKRRHFLDTSENAQASRNSLAEKRTTRHAKSVTTRQQVGGTGNEGEEPSLKESDDNTIAGSNEAFSATSPSTSRLMKTSGSKLKSIITATIESDQKVGTDFSTYPTNDKSPYFNKTVRVIKGRFKGLTGKVIQIHSRGWWSLDNPRMKGKNIHPRYCELVDTIEPSELDLFFRHGKTRALPDIILRQQEQSEYKKRKNDPECSGETNLLERLSKRSRSKKSRGDMEPLACEKQNRQPNKKKDMARNSSRKEHTLKKVLITSTMKESSRKLLEPAIGQPEFGNGQSNMAETLHPFILSSHGDSKEIHEMLRHLPSDYKVEIYDRKYGRILKGDNAIALVDLPSELRRHAEYEPLIPPPSFLESQCKKIDENIDASLLMERNDMGRGLYSREARSSANTRINNTVQPQTKVRASSCEGRSVKIIAGLGPLRGSTGKIDACLPGNWYLVSQLSKKNKYELDYVVHAKCLQMLQDKKKETPKSQDISSPSKDADDEETKETDKILTLPLTENIKTLEQKIVTLKDKIVALKSSHMEENGVRPNVENLEVELRDVSAQLFTKKLTCNMIQGKEN